MKIDDFTIEEKDEDDAFCLNVISLIYKCDCSVTFHIYEIINDVKFNNEGNLLARV